MLRSMWDLPGPGLKPVSPALADGFLTTAPPGKSLRKHLLNEKRARQEVPGWELSGLSGSKVQLVRNQEEPPCETGWV